MIGIHTAFELILKNRKIVGLKNALSAPRAKPVSAAQLKKFLLNHILTKYQKSESPPFEKSEATIEGVRIL